MLKTLLAGAAALLAVLGELVALVGLDAVDAALVAHGAGEALRFVGGEGGGSHEEGRERRLADHPGHGDARKPDRLIDLQQFLDRRDHPVGHASVDLGDPADVNRVL